MLTDTLAIRHYQRITDALVDLWNRGNRYSELQIYLDGYLAALRQTNTVEAHHVHRLEEEAFRFLRDPSNFELALPQPETELDFY